jgi:hypothetical protein
MSPQWECDGCRSTELIVPNVVSVIAVTSTHNHYYCVVLCPSCGESAWLPAGRRLYDRMVAVLEGVQLEAARVAAAFNAIVRPLR